MMLYLRERKQRVLNHFIPIEMQYTLKYCRFTLNKVHETRRRKTIIAEDLVLAGERFYVFLNFSQ